MLRWLFLKDGSCVQPLASFPSHWWFQSPWLHHKLAPGLPSLYLLHFLLGSLCQLFLLPRMFFPLIFTHQKASQHPIANYILPYQQSLCNNFFIKHIFMEYLLHGKFFQKLGKKYSILLVIREIHLKTIMRNLLTTKELLKLDKD